MRKYLLLTLLALTLLLTPGCTKNEFDVKFVLPKSVNGNYRLVYYASDSKKGWFTEEIAPVQDGAFEVKCLTHNPTIVFILRDTNEPAAAFYAERGDDIVINGDSPDPASWKITGNDLTEQWSLWREKNRNVLSSRDAGKINAAVATYVNDNPKDPLAAILLCVYFDRKADRSKFAALWEKLDSDKIKPEFFDLANASDIISGGPVPVENVAGFKLHTAGNGVDSLRLKKTKATLLYFWASDSEERTESMAILKKLSSEYPDSASRNLADICMESDSLSWAYPIASDSLKRVVRGWMPKGFADENAIRLGVGRVPYFIVINSSGQQTYTGDNPMDAANAFRKLMGPK